MCKQLEVLGNLGESDYSSERLREAMGVAQHHDAVSGTEKQHVAFDYAKRLAIAAQECKVKYTLACSIFVGQEELWYPIEFMCKCL